MLGMQNEKYFYKSVKKFYCKIFFTKCIIKTIPRKVPDWLQLQAFTKKGRLREFWHDNCDI